MHIQNIRIWNTQRVGSKSVVLLGTREGSKSAPQVATHSCGAILWIIQNTTSALGLSLVGLSQLSEDS